MVGNFRGYKFSRNRPKFRFQKFSRFQFSRLVNLGPMAIASALGLAPLSGSCVCVYVAFRITSVIAVKGTLTDTLL